MANDLKIRVGVEAGKPDSKFTVQEGGAIVLKNDAGAMLTVTFEGPSPLCPVTATAAAPTPAVQLTAGQSKEYKACAVTTEQAFLYKATMAGAQTESATIIVEKVGVTGPDLRFTEKLPSIVIHREMSGENYFFAAAGLLLGVVLCVFIEPRLGSGRKPPRP